MKANNRNEIKIDFEESNITKRQSECLYYLLRGYNSREIGNFLNISHRTVEDHIELLKSKFNCSSKQKLIEYAIDNGYIYIIPDSIKRR